MGRGRTAGTTTSRRASAAVGAMVLLGLAACSTSTNTGFPTGSGTATITWHGAGGLEPSPRPQPFGGTIAGVPVQGSALSPTPNNHTGGSLPTLLVISRWTGEFDGKTFHFTVTVNTQALSDLTVPEFTVDGTYGPDPVKATVTAPAQHPDSVDFDGTIGPHHVHGTVRPIEHGPSDKAVASFTVSG